MYDVVIVGGGPSGLHCAYRLCRKGLNVAVIDNRARIGKDKICTGILGTEAFERFNLSTESILTSIDTITVVSPGGTRLEYRHPSTLAYVVDRECFDAHLAKLAATEGAEIKNNTRVTRIDINGSAAVVTAEEPDGFKHVYHARMVILATGVNLKLHRRLGLGVPRDFLYGVNAHVRIPGFTSTTIFTGSHLAPGAFAWAVPISGDTVRIGLMTKERPSVYFQRLCRRLLTVEVPESMDSVGYKPIAQGLVYRTYSKRVIALGEAAGQIKTTTGGGIYYGLICSDIAAYVVQKAFDKNCFDEYVLSEYEQLWHKAIGNEIKIGYFMRRLYSRLSDWQIEHILNLIKKKGIMDSLADRIRFDWHGEMLLSVMNKIPLSRFLGIDCSKRNTEFFSEVPN